MQENLQLQCVAVPATQLTFENFCQELYNVRHALQQSATHCNTLQHTVTHCNTLQELYNVRHAPSILLQEEMLKDSQFIDELDGWEGGEGGGGAGIDADLVMRLQVV